MYYSATCKSCSASARNGHIAHLAGRYSVGLGRRARAAEQQDTGSVFPLSASHDIGKCACAPPAIKRSTGSAAFPWVIDALGSRGIGRGRPQWPPAASSASVVANHDTWASRVRQTPWGIDRVPTFTRASQDGTSEGHIVVSVLPGQQGWGMGELSGASLTLCMYLGGGVTTRPPTPARESEDEEGNGRALDDTHRSIASPITIISFRAVISSSFVEP